MKGQKMKSTWKVSRQIVNYWSPLIERKGEPEEADKKTFRNPKESRGLLLNYIPKRDNHSDCPFQFPLYSLFSHNIVLSYPEYH